MGHISKYGFIGTIKRVRKRKKVKNIKNRQNKIKNKKTGKTYEIQVDGETKRTGKSNDHLFEGLKVQTDDDKKEEKIKKTKKEKDDKKVKNTNPNLISFDHELTDFECKLRYLNLKDLTGSEYGRFFPPIRSNLVIIDEDGRKFSAIRAGNNQISGDIIQFLNANDLKPGDKIYFEYDREERSDDGRAVLHLKKK